MTPDIKTKLSGLIERGITKEEQVVYLLAGMRKLIEREEPETQQFKSLRFYCSWALHSKMDHEFAKNILQKLNSVYAQLRENICLNELRNTSGINEIDILTMKTFKKEFDEFLVKYKLPSFNLESWNNFLQLYTKVIEDIPIGYKKPIEYISDRNYQNPPFIKSIEGKCEESTQGNIQSHEIIWYFTRDDGETIKSAGIKLR